MATAFCENVRICTLTWQWCLDLDKSCHSGISLKTYKYNQKPLSVFLYFLNFSLQDEVNTTKDFSTLVNFLRSYLNDTKTKISFLPHSPYDRHMVYWHRCIFECTLVYHMTSSLGIWYLNTCTLHIWLKFHFPNSWYDVDPKTVYPTDAFMEFSCFHSANHWLNRHSPFYISQPIQIKISEGRLSRGM